MPRRHQAVRRARKRSEKRKAAKAEANRKAAEAEAEAKRKAVDIEFLYLLGSGFIAHCYTRCIGCQYDSCTHDTIKNFIELVIAQGWLSNRFTGKGAPCCLCAMGFILYHGIDEFLKKYPRVFRATRS